jgi:Flp pilus assembly protein TadG
MSRTALRARSRAQALAEFALVAPIFFFLLFGILDFGRYVYYVQILNNAAREGARYAIVHGGRSLAPTGPPAPGTVTTDYAGENVKAVVRQYATGVIGDTTTLDIQPTWWDKVTGPQSAGAQNGNNDRENVIQVIVTYNFRSVIPLVPLPPVVVKGSSVLVINN